MTIQIYRNGCHPLPMRPGWKHWASSPADPTWDIVYFLDDIGLRFKVHVTHDCGSDVQLLQHDLTGCGWVNSAIRLPKLLYFDTFEEAMLGAEKLRDWLKERTLAEREALFKKWRARE
jgi:hypothetical protein